MALQDAKVGHNGLYLYSRSFFAREGVYSLFEKNKDAIMQRYLDRFAPQLFAARASASFQGADISTIDNFFEGNETNAGFIAKLQQEVNKYYTDSYRNAEATFSSKTSLNRLLGSKKVAKGGIKAFSVEQWKEFTQMMQAQDEILSNMSQLVSLAQTYVLERCTDAGYKPPRQLKSGLYSLGNYKNEGVREAITIFNKIKETESKLQGAQVTRDFGRNFSVFKTTADKFHAVYGEFLVTICAYNVQRAEQDALKVPFDASWTATGQYTLGQGDLQVDVKKILDPELRELLSQPIEVPELQATATADSMITSTTEGITGTYGGSIKEYSDKTIKALGGFTTIASSMHTIYTAATLATQYGLPQYAADPMWINNLAGGLFGRDNIESMSGMYWTQYVQLVSTLLTLDALMGRMANLNISSNANNLFFYENGKVVYIGELIKNILSSDIHGFTGNMFKQNDLGYQLNVRNKAEAAHWENLISGGDAEAGAAAIRAVVEDVSVKISIDMASILNRM